MTDNTRIVLVTGASRGAGKGIATALATPGSVIYVTGRTERDGDAPLPGSIHDTVREIERRGATGVALRCDHAVDAEVKDAIARIGDAHGRLDILVNNVTVIHDALIEPGGFWEKPLELQEIMNVGMRSHYVSSWHAAPWLIRSERGLLVNTSSFGGVCYMHGPAYGAGKAAVDKMAHDMAYDFKPHGVAAVSLWMGLMITERTSRVMEREPEKYAAFAETAETAEFPGIVIDALWKDPRRMERSGKIWVAAELASEYGLVDANGKQPPSHSAALGAPTQMSDAVII